MQLALDQLLLPLLWFIAPVVRTIKAVAQCLLICINIIEYYRRRLDFWSRVILRPAIKRLCWRLQQRRRSTQIRRRRALSDVSKIPRPQLKSAFFTKLPLEVRQQIYAECFDDISLHVTWDARGFWRKATATSLSRDNRYFHSRDGPTSAAIVQKGLLEFCLVCRQMYAESIEYLYSRHTFWCISTTDFFEMHDIFLPQRLRAITSLGFYLRCPLVYLYDLPRGAFDEYRRMWELVAQLPQLKRLDVELSNWPDNGPVHDEFLQPLMIVTRPERFEVRVRDSPLDLSRLKCAPFRLIVSGKVVL